MWRERAGDSLDVSEFGKNGQPQAADKRVVRNLQPSSHRQKILKKTLDKTFERDIKLKIAFL